MLVLKSKNFNFFSFGSILVKNKKTFSTITTDEKKEVLELVSIMENRKFVLNYESTFLSGNYEESLIAFLEKNNFCKDRGKQDIYRILACYASMEGHFNRSSDCVYGINFSCQSSCKNINMFFPPNQNKFSFFYNMVFSLILKDALCRSLSFYNFELPLASIKDSQEAFFKRWGYQIYESSNGKVDFFFIFYFNSKQKLSFEAFEQMRRLQPYFNEDKSISDVYKADVFLNNYPFLLFYVLLKFQYMISKPEWAFFVDEIYKAALNDSSHASFASAIIHHFSNKFYSFYNPICSEVTLIFYEKILLLQELYKNTPFKNNRNVKVSLDKISFPCTYIPEIIIRDLNLNENASFLFNSLALSDVPYYKISYNIYKICKDSETLSKVYRDGSTFVPIDFDIFLQLKPWHSYTEVDGFESLLEYDNREE